MRVLDLKELQAKLGKTAFSARFIAGFTREDLKDFVEQEIVQPLEREFETQNGIKASDAENRDDFNDIVMCFCDEYCEKIAMKAKSSVEYKLTQAALSKNYTIEFTAAELQILLNLLDTPGEPKP